jgi:ABC-type phosphate/phosphonate transport system substrate-binding protein
MTLIACSRMYNVTPSAAAAWRRLFETVAGMAGVPLEVIDHPAPAPLDALWARPDMGAVFMCGWPFSKQRPSPRIVAVPVPAPARFGDRAVYMSDFVVRNDSPIRVLDDLPGSRFAWMVTGSHSGYNAPRRHLLDLHRRLGGPIFSETVGPLVSPRAVLDAVRDSRADVTAVDGWWFDLLCRHDPAAVASLRVIGSTPAMPIPPIVAAPDTDPAEIDSLRQTFLRLHREPGTAGLLAELELSRFETADPAIYDQPQAWHDEAIAAGYPEIV